VINDSYPKVGKLIDRTIVRLWETIDELENLTPPETMFFRVAIFGSARIEAGDELYGRVREFAGKITDLGCDIVTGGGPGLMQAANEGARGREGGRTRSFGLTIDLPHEQKSNPFLDEVMGHRTFFSRLHHFVRMSHAFAIFPGGIGTLLETSTVWQLLQVGMLKDRPLILFGDMWHGLLDWMNRDMLSRKTIDAEDLKIPLITTSVDEAVAVIRKSKDAFEADRRRFMAERASRPAH
jgi:uncharacterized protein (TIGR00730 family)